MTATTSLFVRLGIACAGVALAAIGNAPVLAQSEPDTDMATGIPQVMVVEDVDRASGIVRFDGNRYRVISGGQRGANVRPPSGSVPLVLSQLEPGMEVVVVTDGTSPGGSRLPEIIAMWEAP